MRQFHTAAAALAAALLVALPHDEAEAARIRCDGSSQIVNGRAVTTPYCEAENLARVAGSYGIRTSGDAMRHNESAKASVCRTVGHDIRVRGVCQNYREDPFIGGGGRRR